MSRLSTILLSALVALLSAAPTTAQRGERGQLALNDTTKASQPAASGEGEAREGEEKTDAVSTAAAAVTAVVPELRFGMDAATVWQSLDVRRDPVGDFGLVPGFHAAVANVTLGAEFEGIGVFTELYLSSKHHQGQVYGHEGYLFLDRLPKSWDKLGLNKVFQYLDVKAGHFELDYGNLRYFRSDNAQVARNPLIGNYVVDPNTVEGGVELIGAFGPVQAVAGFGGGLPTESFQAGTGYSTHAKLTLQPGRNVFEAPFSLSASVYRSDQSRTPTGYPNPGTYSELFAGNRSGERYGGPYLNGRSGWDPEFGQIRAGKGQDVLAWQVDGLVNLGPLFAIAAYGWTKDSDVTGVDLDPNTKQRAVVQTSPDDEWRYYSAEARLDVLPGLYLAGRYSGASTELMMGETVDGSVDRFQIGVGYRLVRGILTKAEYVRQTYDGFSRGLYAGRPTFSGVLLEGSLSLANR
jgi:hypothetical protein